MVKFIPEIRGAFLQFEKDPLTTFCKEAFDCFLTESVSGDQMYSGCFFRLCMEKKGGETAVVHVDAYFPIENNASLFLFDKTEWEIVLKLNSEK